jgi:hypothetical protein
MMGKGEAGARIEVGATPRDALVYIGQGSEISHNRVWQMWSALSYDQVSIHREIGH